VTVTAIGSSRDRANVVDPLAALVRVEFLADYIGPDPAGVYSVRPCEVKGCGRVRHSDARPLCSLHLRRRRRDGEAVDLATWVRSVDPSPATRPTDPPHLRAASRGVFVLQPMAGRLRSEIAFGLQARGTAAAPGRVRAHVVNDLVQRLVAHNVSTVLTVDAAGLVADIGVTQSVSCAVAFVRGTQIALRGALGVPGRIALGLRGGGSAYFADFSAFQLSWFGELARRWTEYRLASERASPQWAGTQLAALARFAEFLSDNRVAQPEDITRALLVDYLAFVSKARQSDGTPFSAVTRSKWLGTVNTFLDDARHLGLEPRLPINARFWPGELPRRPPPQPRFLSEYVMQQVESPEALAMVKRDDLRVAIQILMTTGVRLIHVMTLGRACLEELPRPEGPPAWALLYLDTKTRKAMRVPLRDDVAAAVRRQQERVDRDFGPDCRVLFPRTRAGCVAHVAPQTLHRALADWCQQLLLTDENGQPVRITAHQFRHTCGTRWINHGVSQHVIKNLLGHRTDAMVGVYARLHDSTVRSEWEAFQRVDIQGERVAPPDGDAAEVEWMLESLSRATQALPNGYCALPIQQSCPHANACLTCDSFTTGPEFLPILEQQRDNHDRMLADAEARGQRRMAEINRRPFVSLTSIIDGLRRLPGGDEL